MKKRTSLALAVAGLIVWTSLSCQNKAPLKGIELAVDFSDKPITDNLITNVHYDWKITGEFTKVNKDYTIYVHFWHGRNLLFQDDHLPVVPTSKWEPGQEHKYQRRIYIPSFIDEFDPSFKGEETLKLVVGFYSPNDRTAEPKHEVLIKKLKILPPPPDVPEVIYETGWYDQEVDSEAPLRQWKWTSREARCIIDNPHRDALLVIKGAANAAIVSNQKVMFKIDDMTIDEFIPGGSIFEKSYNIKKEMLGDKDEFSLIIAVDRTGIPAKVMPQSKDERELGCQISLIYFR